MSVYLTNHQGCASTLRYVLGDDAHRRTYRQADGRVAFEFDDPEDRCPELVALFFSSEGIATSNARELLASDRAVRTTYRLCLDQGGDWRKQCPQPA